MANSIDNLKTMLGISNEKLDEKLTLIQEQTEIRLKNKLHLQSDDNIPDELGYIVLEVSIRRFNRINNEGMTAYSENGESISFKDDDFAGFEKDIADWLASNSDSSEPKIKFIDAYGV